MQPIAAASALQSTPDPLADAAVTGAAAPVRATANAGPADGARTVGGVIVEVADGLAVVVAGGRFLGIEGLRQAVPGLRIALSLPTGLPGIGAAVEGRLVDGDAQADPGRALSVRLVAPRLAAIPVRLQRVADGRMVPALLVPSGDDRAMQAATSGHAPHASVDDAVLSVDALVVDGETAGWLQLETPDDRFLVPRDAPGLVPGRRLTLLLPVVLPSDPLPEAATPGVVTGPRPGGVEPAVALAALLARSPESMRGAADARAQRRPQLEAAAGAAEDAPPADAAGEAAEARAGWLCLPERLMWDGEPVRVFMPRPETAESEADGAPGHRRMIVALELSCLGRLQLDLSCMPQRIDLTVRSAAPLDPLTAAEVRAVIAAAADLGGGCLSGVLATGLVGLPAENRQPVAGVIA